MPKQLVLVTSHCCTQIIVSYFQTSAPKPTNVMPQPKGRRAGTWETVYTPPNVWQPNEPWVIMYNVYQETACNAVCYQMGAKDYFWSPRFRLDCGSYVYGMCNCHKDKMPIPVK